VYVLHGLPTQQKWERLVRVLVVSCNAAPRLDGEGTQHAYSNLVLRIKGHANKGSTATFHTFNAKIIQLVHHCIMEFRWR
jgi:hypothetical protein